MRPFIADQRFGARGDAPDSRRMPRVREAFKMPDFNPSTLLCDFAETDARLATFNIEGTRTGRIATRLPAPNGRESEALRIYNKIALPDTAPAYNPPTRDCFSSTHSNYASTIYNPTAYAQLIQRAILKVKVLREQIQFDAIAFRGSSGAALAYPLSAALEIPLVYVRKPEERSHGRPQEGANTDVRTYVIADDFISSGRTVQAIIETLRPARCVGILLYEHTFENSRGDIPVFQL